MKTMLNKDCASEREERKLPAHEEKHCGQEESSEPVNNSFPPETNRDLTEDGSLNKSPERRKGDDGYYYECEICDLGGELLCCDSCPRTYHLECLDPALKDVPEGEWNCPICCPQLASSGSASNAEPSPKRAQTETGVENTRRRRSSLSRRNQRAETLEENIACVGASKSRGKRRRSESIVGGNITDDEMDFEGAAYDSDESEGAVKTSVEDNVAGSQQVDRVIGCRVQRDHMDIETNESSSSESYEYLVKWVGKSHIHNSWVPESELKVWTRRKLDNYKAKYGTVTMDLCKEQWKLPQRVIAIRKSTDGFTEVNVKWTGLPYNECTWERIDEPTIAQSADLIDRFHGFVQKTLETRTVKPKSKSRVHNIKRNKVVALAEQPKELIGGSLFPHQLEALNWLRRRWRKSRNVILADEMGLGKTVSACAFISSLFNEFNVTLPCLVLVPLSTMPNWLSEFSLWAPHLNVVEYHGSARARAIIREYEWHASDAQGVQTSGHKFDVLLTTYEMALCDSSYLAGVAWEVLLVDEGHRLKNSESKLFNTLNTFSFQHRVLLTGTPLQNNIGEMYNLLNFLQPASFPSLSSFEEKFNDLTTAERVEELKKLVAPHMLRRLKKDVMQNIPAKTERVVPVDLSSIQSEYYRAILTKNYQMLRNIRNGAPQQSMLNIVMQLRKVCNHPYLVPGTEPESGSVEFLHAMRIKASSKLSLLHSMLKLLHKEGHRVLIFSQMTKLLDILEDYLSAEFGPEAYERVDGSVAVTDRQAAISRFNQDESRFVFLLSTRACGIGINLATADTVIIYDSDFNPHADIQAMNRAHRIGQTNRLLVYRFVVRASVEERMLQLAKKKLMLDQLFVSKFGSQREIEDILKWGTEELFRDSPGKDGDADNHQSVWDERAVLKLLDRSNLDSSSPCNAEESDMLGSVKDPEMQVDNSVENNEENEWDRLLRVRWEKYQDEEEAALGRGKRQRKAVSYTEPCVDLPIETRANPLVQQNIAKDKPEPERKPERKYTEAGQAHREKYAKLRARQRERLSMAKAANTITRALEDCQATSAQPPAKEAGDDQSRQRSDKKVPREPKQSNEGGTVAGRNNFLSVVVALCAPNAPQSSRRKIPRSQTNRTQSNRRD